jgi:hypothetical protein
MCIGGRRWRWLWGCIVLEAALLCNLAASDLFGSGGCMDKGFFMSRLNDEKEIPHMRKLNWNSM